MKDYSELKRLAEAASGTDWSGSKAYDFMAAANPAAVLAMIAEIERCEIIQFQFEKAIDRARIETAKKLGAELEALRKDANRYHWLKSPRRPIAELDSAFDEHGVPVDHLIDAAMSKESGHD